MARENWVYLNLDKPLIERVDKVVTSIFEDGVTKYPDRKTFVIKAINQLLVKEEKKIISAEAVAN